MASQPFLSVRARNCCKAVGVRTIEELAAFLRHHDLRDIPHCGLKTANELREAVDNYLLSAHREAATHEFEIPATLSSVVNEVFDNQLLSIEDERIREEFSRQFPSAALLVNAAVNSPNSLFTPGHNLGYRLNARLWQHLLDALQGISEVEVGSALETSFVKTIQNTWRTVRSTFQRACNKLLVELLSDGAKRIVAREYKTKFNQLSTRSQNYLRGVNSTPLAIIEILDRIEVEKKGNGYGLGTGKDIIETYGDYKDFLISLTEISDREIEPLLVKNSFSFLKAEEVDHVVEFNRSRGCYPFFYLAFCYFKNTSDRDAKIYDRYNGITAPAERFLDIAQTYNLSSERVRQINLQFRPAKVGQLLEHVTPQQYPFLSEDAIEVEKYCSEISEEEFGGKEENFTAASFVALLCLFAPFRPFDFNAERFLLSRRFEQTIDVRSAWDAISKALHSRPAARVKIPLEILISPYIISDQIGSRKICDFLVQRIVNNYNIEVDENYNIELRRKAMFFEDALIKIIEEAREPMHFDDILHKFYSTYPQYVSKPSGTLHYILLASPRIKCIGKTSTFILSEWADYNTLTLRDLIAAILRESPVPLSLDEIVKILKDKGRHTNKNSVKSNISTDTKNNFVRYNGGLFGVSTKTYPPEFEQQETKESPRKSFADRLKEYLDFVDTHQHAPFLCGEGLEATLYRWVRNVQKGFIESTPEQWEELQCELKKREQYLMPKEEYNFMQRCEEFIHYVKTHCALPTQKTDPSLYIWFQKARKKTIALTGRKRQAYNSLLDFLSHSGYTYSHRRHSRHND